MKKIKNKLLINSISALVASAAIAAPLCSLATRTTISNNSKAIKLASASNAQYTTVKFTDTGYEGKCTITGAATVKARPGMLFSSISKPKILHNDSWKFKGWSIDGTEKISDNYVIPTTGLVLKPLFEKPVDITNCMGVSAIETTTVTFTLQNNNKPDLQYSTDYGKNWIPVTASTTYTMPAGTTIYLKGNNPSGFSTNSDNYTHFDFSAHVNLFGNVLALILNGEPADKLSKVPNSYCFYHMFEGCVNIMNVSDNFLMSEGNEDTSEGKVKVTDCLKEHCYDGMFSGCINISHAPRLYATNENVKNAQGCYKEIYKGCTNLNYVRTRFSGDFTSSDYSACWENWAQGVSSSGKIIYDGPTTTHSASSIPEGWTAAPTPNKVEITTSQTAVSNFIADHEYKLEALCKKDDTELPNEEVVWITDDPNIATVDQSTGVVKGMPVPETVAVPPTVKITAYCKANLNASASITITINPIVKANCTKVVAETDSVFRWTYVGEGMGEARTIPTFKYSTDGLTWKELVKDTDISLTAGDGIYIKGDNPNGLARGDDETSYTNFITKSGKIKIEGDIKGLIFDGRGSNEIGAEPGIPCDYCFKSLFENSNVTSISSSFLSFTNFNSKKYCYMSMFEECHELTTPPALPATTLTDSCYFRMFFNCSSLLTTPALPAGGRVDGAIVGSLADSCYKRMFYGCSSITATPALPAETAKPYCYYMMFQGDNSINTINKISLTTIEKYSCFQMFAFMSNSLFSRIYVNSTSTGAFFHCPNVDLPEGAVTRMFSNTNNDRIVPTKNQYVHLS